MLEDLASEQEVVDPREKKRLIILLELLTKNIYFFPLCAKVYLMNESWDQLKKKMYRYQGKFFIFL